MMRGIRRLVVYTAVSGLIAAGAVTASLQVARADNFAAACGGNGSNGYICNLDTVVPSPGSISVGVDSGSASEQVNVNWTVACTNGSSSGNEEGATDNAATPLTVPLAPLPPAANGGQCNVNVGISLPNPDLTPKIAYTGTLTLRASEANTSWRDLVGGGEIAASGTSLSVNLAPQGILVLLRQK